MIRVHVSSIESPMHRVGFDGNLHISARLEVEGWTLSELKLASGFLRKMSEGRGKEFDAHDLVALEMLLSIPFYMRGKAFEMFWAFYRLSSAEQDVVKDFMLDMKSGRKNG